MILLTLFVTFFKIGLFTFGGGYAMLPLIQKEVLAHNWMAMEDLVNFIAVSESTPGPFAVNVSTYVGRVVGGIPGAFCATTGVVLPSFLIILLVAKGYERFKESKIVKGAMNGLHPAVVGLIAAAALSIGQSVFLHNGQQRLSIENGISVGIMILAGFLLYKKKHPILVIVLSGVIGILFGYLVH
ncbi:chromate transporter [Anaerosporobacter faecicola]|uniref:chromate transporter n=1 Tax=Anaerosporobacter faecicola TaxID=2718714 RepID=UPI00143C2FC1|nr:chromate transporter [Anaerosporobacter faecicola]